MDRKICEKKVGQYPATPTVSWIPVETAPPKYWRPFCYDSYDDEGNQHDGCVGWRKKPIEEQSGPCQFCIYKDSETEKVTKYE
jgi:hypothetical protein